MTHPAPDPPGRPSRGLPGTALRVRRLAATAAPLVLLILPSACGENERPPVPDADMVAVLAEMHLAQARAEHAGTLVSDAQDSLLAARGIDSAAWANAVDWYASRPEIFAGIYGRVVDTLQARQIPDDAMATPQASPSPFP